MFWFKNGAIIVNSNGQPIDCEHCPCALSSTQFLLITNYYKCELKGIINDENGQYWQPRKMG